MRGMEDTPGADWEGLMGADLWRMKEAERKIYGWRFLAEK